MQPAKRLPSALSRGASSRPCYDPRTDGALCDTCPLGPDGALRKAGWPWRPVGSKLREQAVATVVALSPGHSEEAAGYPLAGKSGAEHNDALAACDWKRTALSEVNIRSCRYGGPDDPASGENERMEGALRKLRATAMKETQATSLSRTEAQRVVEARYPHPALCCYPRLKYDIRDCDNLIAYGKEAMEALTGETKAITEIAASPRETEVMGRVRRVMPSVHPSFVLHAPGNRVVFRAALAKAKRWFSVGLHFPKPVMRWWAPEAASVASQQAKEGAEQTIVAGGDPYDLEQWLTSSCPDGRPTDHFVYDIETDGTETLRCRIRCIGIGKVPVGWKPEEGLGEVALVSLLDRETGEPLWDASDEEALVDAIVEWAAGPETKTGHNSVIFDGSVMARRLGAVVASNRDTMVLAAHWTPDVKRALGIVGSVLTDIEDWKNDHEGNKLATGAATNEELGLYCGRGDVAVTAAVEPQLLAVAEMKGASDPLPEVYRPEGWSASRPWTLLEVDHFAVEMCAKMHEVGVLVDQDRLQAHEVALRASVKKSREDAVLRATEAAVAMTGSDRVLREIAGLRDDEEARAAKAMREARRFNPNSTKQLGKLLYDVCGLAAPDFTDAGAESTDEAALKSLLLDDETPGVAREVIKATLRLRSDVLSIGRYIQPLKTWANGGVVFDETGPGSQAPYDEDDPYAYKLHPQWRLGTGVGRLSCGGKVHDRDLERQSLPLQQAPRWLRDVFMAPPGFTFVSSDFNQAHPRILAHLWSIPRLCEAFEKGYDPYGMLADLLFGSRYRNADGWGPDGFSLKRKPKLGRAYKSRMLCKTLQLASAYHAGIATICDQIWSIMDDETGEPLFGDFARDDIEKLHAKLMRAEEEWEEGWQQEVSLFEKQGYLESLLFRRRSGSLKDGHITDVCNFTTLSTEADLKRRADVTFTSRVPWEYGYDAMGRLTPYGMCIDMHDGTIALVPSERAERAKRDLQEAMEQPVDGFRIPFTAEMGEGTRWSET